MVLDRIKVPIPLSVMPISFYFRNSCRTRIFGNFSLSSQVSLVDLSCLFFPFPFLVQMFPPSIMEHFERQVHSAHCLCSRFGSLTLPNPFILFNRIMLSHFNSLIFLY